MKKELDYSKLELDSYSNANRTLEELDDKNIEFIYKENKDEILSKKKYPFYIIVDKIKNKIGITNFSLLEFQKEEYEKCLDDNKHANKISDTILSFLILIIIICLTIFSILAL